jgi:hypothetical protein
MEPTFQASLVDTLKQAAPTLFVIMEKCVIRRRDWFVLYIMRHCVVSLVLVEIRGKC